jgi:hypothetical protein
MGETRCATRATPFWKKKRRKLLVQSPQEAVSTCAFCGETGRKPICSETRAWRLYLGNIAFWLRLHGRNTLRHSRDPFLEEETSEFAGVDAAEGAFDMRLLWRNRPKTDFCYKIGAWRLYLGGIALWLPLVS